MDPQNFISRLYTSFTVQQQPTDICIIKLFLHQSQNLLNNQKRRKCNPKFKKYRCMTKLSIKYCFTFPCKHTKCFHQNRVECQAPLKTALQLSSFTSVFTKFCYCKKKKINKIINSLKHYKWDLEQVFVQKIKNVGKMEL